MEAFASEYVHHEAMGLHAGVKVKKQTWLDVLYVDNDKPEYPEILPREVVSRMHRVVKEMERKFLTLGQMFFDGCVYYSASFCKGISSLNRCLLQRVYAGSGPLGQHHGDRGGIQAVRGERVADIEGLAQVLHGGPRAAVEAEGARHAGDAVGLCSVCLGGGLVR